MSAFFCFTTLIVFFLSSWLAPAYALTFSSEQQAEKAVAIHYSADKHEVISGTITNNSQHVIRNPEVLIEYHWLWANERHPGNHSPGRAAYVEVDKEIQPGQSVGFTYRPHPALREARNGRFMPEVSVASFTTLLPQQRAASR